MPLQTQLPAHLAKGRSDLGGPVTGAYMTITAGPINVAQSQAVTDIQWAMKLPLPVRVQHVHAFATTVGGGTVQVTASQNTGRSTVGDSHLFAATDMAAGSLVEFAVDATGNLDATLDGDYRDIAKDSYLMLEAVTGVGETITGLTVTFVVNTAGHAVLDPAYD